MPSRLLCTAGAGRADGKKTASSRFFAFGKPGKLIIFQCSDHGNMITETVTSPDGSVETFSYAYESDNRNNWTRKIKFQAKKPLNILVREIGYE
ncbi:MAG: hypothetical protein WCO44_13785 [Bacteroidota bacterium]